MFNSILYISTDQASLPVKSPSTSELEDLQLTDILKRLETYSPWKEIKKIFLKPLDDQSLILYRQAVMKDLSSKKFCQLTEDFSKTILDLDNKIQVLKHKSNFQNDLMDCSEYLQLADSYCRSLEKFSGADWDSLSSMGMKRFLRELREYMNSPDYLKMKNSVDQIYQRMEQVHFCMLIKDGRFKIRPYENQRQLDGEVKALFSRFRQSDHEREQTDPPALHPMHHIDAAILDVLSHWYSEDFELLKQFPMDETSFLEEGILNFAREVCFYVSWQKLIHPLLEDGLPFCFPSLNENKKELFCEDGFDLALALKLYSQDQKTVTNSFLLKDEERTLVVTGPNQGGKTTFARFFGQTFYLASLGCLIPGTSASLRCFDHIYTHFNQKEDLDNLSGKLQDDILRLRTIQDHATKNSILVINEIYASTTLRDAIFLGRKMMEKISHTGCLAIIVTFLDELAGYDVHTVSMMSTVNENDPAKRNYKIIRKPADGLAYAMHLAEKYGLSYKALDRRLKG